MRTLLRVFLPVMIALLLTGPSVAETCVECHNKITPNIVSDWELSKHSVNGVEYSVCHGNEHQSADDMAKVKIPARKHSGSATRSGSPGVRSRKATG